MTNEEAIIAPMTPHEVMGYLAVAIQLHLWCRGMPGPSLRPEDMTCVDCDFRSRCPEAWDLYNTDGDCLGSK